MRKTILLFLVASVFTVSTQLRAADIDWKSTMVIAEPQRDVEGKLLPLQSHKETVQRGMRFLLDNHAKWFKGPPESLVDEQGRTQMPWVYYSNLQQNGAPFTSSIDHFVSYPAFHHALVIKTFLRHWKTSPDKRALEQAVTLADWNIAHSTPADWPYAGLPWSTFHEKKPGGFRDKSGLMPDKAAIMALAYLELYDATGEKRFLEAATAIGRSLAARQRPNGTWPFRVDPKTEEVIEDYSSSMIYAVMLFEALDKHSGTETFRPNRDRAWNWLVSGPIKNKDWRGFYEDIPENKNNRASVPGDFDTPEQRLGFFQDWRPWESCICLTHSWSYSGGEPKSRDQLIQMIVANTACDGNLLISWGPQWNGEFAPKEKDRLIEVGDWLKQNGRSIYGTRGGPWKWSSWGGSTRRGKTAWLHVVKGEKLEIPALPGVTVVSAQTLNGEKVDFQQDAKKLTVTVPKPRRFRSSNSPLTNPWTAFPPFTG